MTKAEILAELKRSGEISLFRRSPTWEKAFELHNKTTGQHKKMSCGSCYRDVIAWLQG